MTLIQRSVIWRRGKILFFVETLNSFNNSLMKKSKNVSSKQKVYWSITAKKQYCPDQTEPGIVTKSFLSSRTCSCFHCNNEKVISIIQTVVVIFHSFFNSILLDIEEKHKIFSKSFPANCKLVARNKIKKTHSNNKKLISTMQKLYSSYFLLFNFS